MMYDVFKEQHNLLVISKKDLSEISNSHRVASVSAMIKAGWFILVQVTKTIRVYTLIGKTVGETSLFT